MNPSGSNQRGAHAAQRGAGAAPRARPADDWSAAWPRWVAFRAKIGERAWACWFAGCRLDGAETALRAPGAHSRDELRSRFGAVLEAHFGAPVTITCEGAAAARGEGGATHKPVSGSVRER